MHCFPKNYHHFKKIAQACLLRLPLFASLECVQHTFWKAYIKTLGIACVKSLRMRASYLLECMQQTFRSVCILPVEMCTFFSLSASVHIFLLSALFSVFESLSICLCPRNLNLILVRKKYYEMISISLAVTVDT